MTRSIYVIEDTDTLPRRKLFRFLGIDWLGTPYWWISPIWMLAAGFGIAYWRMTGEFSTEIVLPSLWYTIIVIVTVFNHTFGHLIGGKLSGHMMDANLLTATMPVNVYDGKRYPSRVHIIRSLGGPMFNLFIGIGAFSLDVLLNGNEYVLVLGYLNVLFFFISATPIRSLDGGVVVRELRNWRKE